MNADNASPTTSPAKPKVRGRLVVTNAYTAEGCDVIDTKTGAVVNYPSERQAKEAAAFYRAYLRKWGDVCLYSAPYSLDDPFTAREAYMNAHEGNEPQEVSESAPRHLRAIADDMDADTRHSALRTKSGTAPLRMNLRSPEERNARKKGKA